MDLEKINKVLINIGLIISFGFGVGHFFIPYVINWFEYIPNTPKTLVISIRWTNFFFSFVLTGYTLILLLLQKRIIHRDLVAMVFYAFLVFLWFSRIIMILILPWNGVYDLLFLFQLISFIAIFIILLIPLIIL